jgi:GNAT superfamily N-acetyltransferase
MNSLRLVSDYKHEDRLRLSFNALAQKVFDIDFEEWYQRGSWDDTYICYSYADGDRIVANVSLNKMNLLLDGRPYRALQIGTVMTDPDYRLQGLSRQLLEMALAEHELDYDFTYLYANPDVAEFYPRLGFKELPLSRIYADIPAAGSKSHQLRKLDINHEADWNLIKEMVHSRSPLSKRCSAIGAAGIFAWYCLNVFPEDIYYSDEADLLAVFQKDGNKLELFDVVSRQPVQLDHFLGALAGEDGIRVEFNFTPELGSIKPVTEQLSGGEDLFFIKPANGQLPEGVILPMTARA